MNFLCTFITKFSLNHPNTTLLFFFIRNVHVFLKEYFKSNYSKYVVLDVVILVSSFFLSYCLFDKFKGYKKKNLDIDYEKEMNFLS